MLKNKHQSKFIFITGGVVSSVGKGLVASSLGTLMESRGFKINIIKCDPYINVDPGTLSPFQHGEVYVTHDGAETDLDLGNYERFTKLRLNKEHSITTGQIYQKVINKERRGDYLGRTVQVIPHITDEIKNRILAGSKQAEITIVEIGGTVGDIEGLPFIEAIRQLRIEMGPQNIIFAHVTFIPFIPSVEEYKSKPTQHSVKALREVGIQPDFLLCRSVDTINDELKQKIALFSSVSVKDVILVKDAQSIYEIPLFLNKEKLDERLIKKMNLKSPKAHLKEWERLVKNIKSPKKHINIALVGKYVHLKDSYQSIHEALVHGGLSSKIKIKLKYINSDKKIDVADFKSVSGVLVPGGFGDRGIKGKLQVIQYCRENNLPFFGICLGMQMAVVEFAKNVCGLKDACSRECESSKDSQNVVIDYMPNQKDVINTGGSMRLGSYPCSLLKGTKVQKIYNSYLIKERHRHRYEFNSDFIKQFKQAGLVFSGHFTKNKNLIEIIEIPNHPWFIGVQFHPEFQSKPIKPHPLFESFVQACAQQA